MSDSDIDVLGKLKACVRSRATLTFRDGEIIVADIDVVLETENAIVFELVTSSRPENYEKTDSRPRIYAAITDLMDCEPYSEPAAG